LFLRYPENPVISVNVRFLDRVLADDNGLVLTVDGYSAVLTIPRGVEAAFELAGQLALYTRSAPIADQETYEHTKTVLKARTKRQRFTGDFVVVGEDRVQTTDELIYIGDFVCWISDAEAYAEAVASLPLPTGQLQAGLAMLVVMQWRRDEDAELLRRRIVEYEESLKPGGT
jgi:hypothetical protein